MLQLKYKKNKSKALILVLFDFEIYLVDWDKSQFFFLWIGM